MSQANAESSRSSDQVRMWILVAGPYSAPTAEQRQKNLEALNKAAFEVFLKGHIPIVGLNNALPLFDLEGNEVEHNELIMQISLAVAERCDAVLRIARSPGADREVELFQSQGKPLFECIEDVPEGD
jgi:hypothetical protein